MAKTRKLSLNATGTLGELKAEMEAKWPFIEKFPYKIGVNLEFIDEKDHETWPIQDGDEIAIMPPYAGG